MQQKTRIPSGGDIHSLQIIHNLSTLQLYALLVINVNARIIAHLLIQPKKSSIILLNTRQNCVLKVLIVLSRQCAHSLIHHQISEMLQIISSQLNKVKLLHLVKAIIMQVQEAQMLATDILGIKIHTILQIIIKTSLESLLVILITITSAVTITQQN